MSVRPAVILRVALGAAAIALVGIQVVPVDRSNPPVTMDVPSPGEVKAILRRSCYDCHSNETAWPWYGYVAPVSWLIARDVHRGREELNFSTWDRYPADERAELIEEAYEEASEGEMPLPIYLALHGEARLSPDDLRVLASWADDE